MTLLSLSIALALSQAQPPSTPLAAASARARAALLARHGEAQGARIDRGLDQVAAAWRPADGSPEAFEEIGRAHV